jgi:phosphoribosylformylglycinamidine synthase
MGEELGAEVWLEKCPLKYEGLSYTEIWISEAQERMVLAVPPENWQELRELCESEGVEAAAIGRFVSTGKLLLTYHGQTVGELAMSYLHEGRPPVVRDAIYQPPQATALTPPPIALESGNRIVADILGSLNVASKHWVIRQYDHEVQGGSVVKPLVGPQCDGPSDAAVVRPLLDSRRGLVIACGMNPRLGDFDTYHMAASAIDEAVRNAVAVGADPETIAILDNFCWGYTDRPETLGSLVRAAIACQDVAVGLGTPFISGKDSLNNEFSYVDASGVKRSISIPPSLLISAIGQVDDISLAVTMDLKQPGNRLYLIGETHDELGGSHYAMVTNQTGGQVPRVDIPLAKKTFVAMHQAIRKRLVRSVHDLSEGGLAVAAAEMGMAGRLGISIDAGGIEGGTEKLGDAAKLFSESNTRFLVEVAPAQENALTELFAKAGVACLRIGQVDLSDQVRIYLGGKAVVDAKLDSLLHRWKNPLNW